MRRLVEQKLAAWTSSPERRPLLVRGARQVGKTWSVREFGRDSFDGHIHILDLEQRPEVKKYFEGDLDPRRVIADIELSVDAAIVPGRDLLFIDEIQACPRALLALRYFYEQMPELHVIAAGSLIEFALGGASFPVGRVDHLHLQPMTFVEYLWAIGRDPMAELILAGPALLPRPRIGSFSRNCGATCSWGACLPP